MDLNRIHEKLTNLVFLASNSLQKKSVKLQLDPPFLWSEFHNAIWSEEVHTVSLDSAGPRPFCKKIATSCGFGVYLGYLSDLGFIYDKDKNEVKIYLLHSLVK